VLQAEYETWLRDEVGLCERMGALLGNAGQSKGEGDGRDAEDRIKRYCLDCQGALRHVETASTGLL
jgi:hypothetical protein